MVQSKFTQLTLKNCFFNNILYSQEKLEFLLIKIVWGIKGLSKDMNKKKWGLSED